MAIALTHAHIDALGDDPADLAAGKVVGSHWNASHTVPQTGTGSNVVSDVAPSITDPVTITNTQPDTTGLTVTGNSDTLHSGGGVPAFVVNQKWDTGGVEWGRGIQLNVNNVGSAANSFLIEANISGVGAGQAFLVRYSGGSSTTEFSTGTGPLSFFSLVGRLLFGSAGLTRWTIETDGCLLNWNPAVINGGCTTVAGLAGFATHGAGARFAVTDSTLTYAAGVGQAVVGLGGFTVPVFWDGANWLIG